MFKQKYHKLEVKTTEINKIQSVLTWDNITETFIYKDKDYQNEIDTFTGLSFKELANQNIFEVRDNVNPYYGDNTMNQQDIHTQHNAMKLLEEVEAHNREMEQVEQEQYILDKELELLNPEPLPPPAPTQTPTGGKNET